MASARGCRVLFSVSAALAYHFLFLITLKSTSGLRWSPLIADLVVGQLIKATSPGNSKGKSNHDENHRLSGVQAFIKSQSTGDTSGYKEIFALFLELLEDLNPQPFVECHLR